MLGIELDTRRRNRLNGIVRNSSEAGFDIEVAQSFGNCPQYIQLRDFEFVRDSASASKQEPVRLSEFSERARAMITGADTLFVASYVDIDGSLGKSTSRIVVAGRASCVWTKMAF